MEAQKKTDVLLVEITERAVKAQKEQAEVSATEDVLLNEAAVVSKGKTEAEVVLAAAPVPAHAGVRLQTGQVRARERRQAVHLGRGHVHLPPTMYTYHHFAKIEAQREAEGKVRVTGAKLQNNEDELAKVEADLDQCQARLNGAKKRKQDLQDDAEETEKRMEAADGPDRRRIRRVRPVADPVQWVQGHHPATGP